MTSPGPQDRGGRRYERRKDGRVKYDGMKRRFESRGKRYEEKVNALAPNTVRRVGKKGRKGSSRGPCYLTTACCTAMGLPDDCPELQTLRVFRDSVLLATSEGRALVDQYYAMAPGIVRGVERKEGPRANTVWRQVFGRVCRIARLIRAGDHDGATTAYKQLSFSLRARYLD